MIRTNAVVILLGIGILLGASGRAIAADAPAPKINYQDHVLPILRNACLNCHNPDKKKGDLSLSTFAGAMQGGSGKIIEPGDAEGSKLIKLITGEEEPSMPPKGDKLPDKDIALIKQWIAAGAPESSSSKVAAVKPKAKLGVVTSIGKPEGPIAMPPAGLPTEPVAKVKHMSSINSLAASPWAPVIAVGGEKQIALYNSDTFEILGVLAFGEGIPNVLKFSRNGQLLMAAGGVGAKSGKIVAWNVTTGQRAVEVGDEFDAILAADISPDQTHVAVGTPLRMLKVYTTADGQVETSIKKHTDWVTAVGYSPDGKYLVSGDRQGGLFVWESAGVREYYNCQGHKEGITDACFRGDSKVMASASSDGTFKLWNMDDGKVIQTVTAHAGGVLSIAFTHDGRIVTAGKDQLVKIWSPTGALIKATEPFTDIVVKAIFTHDGKSVIGGDFNGNVRAFAVPDGKRIAELPSNPLTAAQRLASIDDKIKQLMPQLEKANVDLKNAQVAMDNINAQLKQAQDLKDQSEKWIATTTVALDTAKAEKDKQPEYQKTTQAMKEARSKAQQGVETLQTELKSMTRKITEGQAAAESQTRALEKAKAAAEKKPKDAALVEAVTKAQAKLEKTQGELAELKKGYETTNARLQPARDAYAKTVTDYDAAAKKAAEAGAGLPAAKANAEKARTQLEQAKKAIDAHLKTQKTAAEQLVKVQADQKVVQQSFDALTAQKSKLASK